MKIERAAFVPWYSIADIAADWGWTETNVLAAAEAGHFALTERTAFGTPTLTMSADDKHRLEAQTPDATKIRDLRADARQSYVEALALVMADWYGSDPELVLKPYELAGELERFAATAGIPLSRGTKTLAEILGAAAEHLKKCGYVTGAKTVQADDLDIHQKVG